jgi:hypothetical protein
MARRALIAFSILIGLFLAGMFSLRLMARHSIVPKDEALVRTRQLVERAGGASKICDEAASLFRRFGGSKVKFFRAEDLNDCPSIQMLGKVDGILPTMDDSFIKVRVGNHFRGFEIHVFATDLRADVAAFLHEKQVDGCIYVLD